ncbi:MAG: 16S rRNA (uracil(1498)-N(3))-methyltransferase [Deinococcales bacterium]|nr:16S rRNA (uracil(1498)-N(3))-methyltransferase [Chitinophagaceae bacterium]
MALPFFYQTQIIAASSVLLSEETSKHCIQVLRMKVGERIQLTDGKGNAYVVAIIKSDKRHCEVIIEDTSFQSPSEKQIAIGISLLKNATRFEWFLEKATELGVCEIIPLLCTRTERQHFRFDRMQSIVIAAMLQSQQVWLPILHQPTDVQKVLQSSVQIQKLIAHCQAGAKQAIGSLVVLQAVQILIGPEGDFTTAEIDEALQKTYIPVSLGNTRLRTETAGVVAATLLVNT